VTDRPTPKPRADWEAIERDYRLGIYTVVELAERHHGVVTRQAIAKRAKVKGWSKDLTTAVRQATAAKLLAAQQREAEVAQEKVAVAQKVALVAFEATDAVEVASSANAGVILRHRNNLLQISDAVVRMLGELTDVTLHPGELQGMFDMLHSECTPPELSAAQRRFDALLELPTRIGSVQKLVDAMVKAQAGERKAHQLDDDEGNPKDGDGFWLGVAGDKGSL
jgi:hypothetical protein